MSANNPPVSDSPQPGAGAEVPSPFIPLWVLGIELGALCLHSKHVSKCTHSSANFPSLDDAIRNSATLLASCHLQG